MKIIKDMGSYLKPLFIAIIGGIAIQAVSFVLKPQTSIWIHMIGVLIFIIVFMFLVKVYEHLKFEKYKRKYGKIKISDLLDRNCHTMPSKDYYELKKRPWKDLWNYLAQLFQIIRLIKKLVLRIVYTAPMVLFWIIAFAMFSNIEAASAITLSHIKLSDFKLLFEITIAASWLIVSLHFLLFPKKWGLSSVFGKQSNKELSKVLPAELKIEETDFLKIVWEPCAGKT